MALGDIPPRRNLPGESEQWGRTLEERASGVESGASRFQQNRSSQSRAGSALLSSLSSSVQRLQETAGVIAPLSGGVYMFDPPVGTVSLGYSWNIPAPSWATSASVYSLGWDVSNVEEGAGGGAAYLWAYVQPANQTPSQGSPLFTEAGVFPGGAFYDDPYPGVSPVSGGGVTVHLWFVRPDPGAVYNFDLDWDILVQWA